ncbi:MAG: hypothetical protein ABIA02_03550 [Candidatus Falkowbacteria bacterium]
MKTIILKLFKILKIFPVKAYLIILLLANFINWISAYSINKKVSQDLVYLHYNVNFGVNLIGDVQKIYIIPFLGFIIILINFILLNLIYKYKKDKFIIHLLLAAAFASNLFLLAGTASVYLINFR